jgi:hypothetical protein
MAIFDYEHHDRNELFFPGWDGRWIYQRHCSRVNSLFFFFGWVATYTCTLCFCWIAGKQEMKGVITNCQFVI